MSKILFSPKQVLQLQKKPNVQQVSERTITYTDTFKSQFMDEYFAGKTPRQIFKERASRGNNRESIYRLLPMTSGNLSDSKAAIPLLKKVEDQFPGHFKTAIFDAGYDYEPIYRQLHAYQIRAVIPYNVRNEGEYL